MTVLHCKSREVHCPLVHLSPLPQSSPSGAVTSFGQEEDEPEQRSSGSQESVLARQTVSALAKRQLRQQSSLESSHSALGLKRHVPGSQHALSPQPSSPPQSHSSPSSTMPLPHCWPEIVGTFLLSEKQDVLTLLRPMAEHMLPMEQGLNPVIPVDVEGFMMNLSPALQVDELRGQHCCALTALLSRHVLSKQSCTAPKVCPVSCLPKESADSLQAKRGPITAAECTLQ